MTLRDLFTDKSIYDMHGDMDVANDCIDEMAAAWCGTRLTKAGLEHYGEDLLSTRFAIDGAVVEVGVDEYEDCEKRWEAVKELFADAAGYCSGDDYDLWFTDEDGPVEPEKRYNAGFEIIAEEKTEAPSRLEGVALGKKETSFGPEWVTWEWVERPGEKRSYFWGHYFSDYKTAAKDYHKRALELF